MKGNWLEWQEEVNQWLHGNSSVQVLVTILDEEPLPKTQGRGQQMAAVLEKLAQAGAFAGIEPLVWQREVRLSSWVAWTQGLMLLDSNIIIYATHPELI